jgi:hypothetical protein
LIAGGSSLPLRVTSWASLQTLPALATNIGEQHA